MSLAGGKMVHVPGRCVRLPKGHKSHNRRHCGPGETWRAGYDREVRATRKSLKTIEKNIKSGVVSHRIGRACQNSEIAEAIDACMSNFIDSVREHMAQKEHLHLENYPTESTLRMIQNKSRIGTQCVLKSLSQCGGNKDQVRLLVDEYVQKELDVASMIPDMDKTIVQNRINKLSTLEQFVQEHRGSKVDDDDESVAGGARYKRIASQLW